ncbi:TetR/AcrR family transcriptional regulator [Siphonobacter aquaeclarae]|uniref:Transcriptional regulator, TetR family n=1 Tax=Siphonobacter aquaeclarae TaxID=563176 RepID=A0A1G9SN94_9BACT|nr:TetR/AcrR family transcriptional regulator [Siphonobacter aquaeclarae]MBO9637532.1 TetR/AcrR family transcriptional regulator [Siphonobacter aquaeclarae]SDM36874.1 transcriptional regulator, TetR family [Siphonobacter aquaeclarae]
MRPKDEQKERAIRQKAIEMIAEQGLDGLSMQKLAKSAGVSPATLYIYYKDRDDLIVQVCVEETLRMFRATLENFDPQMSFGDGLRIQWLNRARFCMANKWSVAFTEQIRHSPYHSRAMELIGTEMSDVLGQFVRNNVVRGELVRMPFEAYWSIAFSPLYQLIKFHFQGRSFPNHEPFVLTEELLLQTMQLVLKALTP